VADAAKLVQAGAGACRTELRSNRPRFYWELRRGSRAQFLAWLLLHTSSPLQKVPHARVRTTVNPVDNSSIHAGLPGQRANMLQRSPPNTAMTRPMVHAEDQDGTARYQEVLHRCDGTVVPGAWPGRWPRSAGRRCPHSWALPASAPRLQQRSSAPPGMPLSSPGGIWDNLDS
jgi:hypothetical protein